MSNSSRMLKRLAAALCAMAMLFSATAFAQETTLDALISHLADDATRSIKLSGPNFHMYNRTVMPANYASMPASYDLREQGYVPEVRSQGNWGTCWGFAVIAASEISLLADLGITAADFADLTGMEMDLSEKHLSWFGAGHLPALEDYAEGEYPFPGLEDQAGEGIHNLHEATVGVNARYSSGGMMAYGASLFAAGSGPVLEIEYPYVAADGSDSTAADWSLPEESRFSVTFELENSSILPSPAMRDENDQYIYNPYGTFAIKQELINGRAVSIGYHSEQNMDPDAYFTQIKDQLPVLGITCTDEDFDIFRASQIGEITFADMTPGAIALLTKLMLYDLGTPPAEAEETVNALSPEEVETLLQQTIAAADAAQAASAATMAEEESLKRAKAEELGFDYDDFQAGIEKAAAANAVQYMNFETYAQYTNTTLADLDHSVTIVGWDDNYPATNFLEGQQPPADGAWIVRNSWDSDYGLDGYFYLSYFDQTIVCPESFDFVTSYKAGAPTRVNLSLMDFMPTSAYMSAHVENNAGYANMFEPAKDNYVLRYVGVLTADLNAEVTTDVYLLNDDAALPTDGILLDRVITDYDFGGYHRIQLNHDFIIPEGARISVIVTQRAIDGETAVCSIPYALDLNQKYAETYNAFAPNNRKSPIYMESRVNKGESWVCVDGQWHDWTDVLELLKTESTAANYFAYDNLSIKTYSYMLEELQGMHNFDCSVQFNGATMHQCSDCSYALVEQK